MSTTPQEHKASAPQALPCAVLTVSDTRTLETDTGGQTVLEHLERAGHRVVYREIVPDEPARMRTLVERWVAEGRVAAILLTGGTGLSSRDQTYETVSRLFTKHIPGYGELFRQLSFAEIGPAALLSRTTGGLVGSVVLLTMPGSPAAVRLAMEQIIIPELPHLVREARR